MSVRAAESFPLLAISTYTADMWSPSTGKDLGIGFQRGLPMPHTDPIIRILRSHNKLQGGVLPSAEVFQDRAALSSRKIGQSKQCKRAPPDLIGQSSSGSLSFRLEPQNFGSIAH